MSLDSPRPSTRELVARVSALETALGAAQSQLQPQALRQRLERTIDPRGGEPRIMDADGFTLDYAPTIKFTGDGAAVTLNAPERRIEVDVTGGGGGGGVDTTIIELPGVEVWVPTDADLYNSGSDGWFINDPIVYIKQGNTVHIIGSVQWVGAGGGYPHSTTSIIRNASVPTAFKPAGVRRTRLFTATNTTTDGEWETSMLTNGLLQIGGMHTGAPGFPWGTIGSGTPVIDLSWTYPLVQSAVAGGSGGYGVTGGLVWDDDFSTDLLATEYDGVAGFTVSGGVLVVPSGASNLLRYGPAYQTAQLIKLTAPGTVTGAADEYVFVQVRVCGATLDTSVGLKYQPSYSGAPGGAKATLSVATRTAGASPAPIGSNAYGATAHPVTTAYWLMLISTGVNDLSAYVFDVDPLTNTTTAPIITNGVNGYTFPHPQRALGAPVGIVCSMPTGWTIDDYKVWNV